MNTTSNITSKQAVAAIALALLLALPAYSATVTLNPAADAFVTAGPTGNLSGNNYGAAGALSVAASGLAKGEFQSVLRFDLSGAKTSFNSQFGAGQWSIQSITLSLTATAPNNAIFNASAAGQTLIGSINNCIRSFLRDIATGQHYQSFIDFRLHQLCSPNIFDLLMIIDRHIKRKIEQL